MVNRNYLSSNETKLEKTRLNMPLSAVEIRVFHILSIVYVYTLRVHYELTQMNSSQWA